MPRLRIWVTAAMWMAWLSWRFPRRDSRWILRLPEDLVPEGTDPNPGWSPPARTEPVLFAEAALDAIAALLDGRRWLPADDLEAIADTLRKTGRRIGEPR